MQGYRTPFYKNSSLRRAPVGFHVSLGGKISVVESYGSVSASLLLHGKENEWSFASKQLSLGTRVVLFPLWAWGSLMKAEH